jgi:hypothetical protein
MKMRLRLANGERAGAPDLAGMAAFFLTPAVVCLWALAFWRVAADLGLARPFFLNNGALSHWQTWFVAALLAQAALFGLRRASGPAHPGHQRDPPRRQVVRVETPGPWAG